MRDEQEPASLLPSDYTTVGMGTGRNDGPTTALLHAFHERVKPMVQNLAEEGWPVTMVLTRDDDDSVWFNVRCQLRKGTPPDA